VTVKQLCDLLANYADDRELIVGGSVAWELVGVRSVEPDGKVILVSGHMLSSAAYFATEAPNR